MISIRKSGERGYFDFGWLKTYHTFSFGEYHDPKHMHFRSLRVINEDFVASGGGFPTHPHRDMEIITYILEGELEHKDSMGNGQVIRPGEVQRMSAGTGVTHSEFNPSQKNPVHLLQIWIFPDQKNLTPSYEQTSFAKELAKGDWVLAASPSGESGSVKIHQDARLWLIRMKKGDEKTFRLDPSRHAWLQVARGSLEVEGQELHASDGAAVSEQGRLRIIAKTDAESILFDLQ